MKALCEQNDGIHQHKEANTAHTPTDRERECRRKKIPGLF